MLVKDWYFQVGNLHKHHTSITASGLRSGQERKKQGQSYHEEDQIKETHEKETVVKTM